MCVLFGRVRSSTRPPVAAHLRARGRRGRGTLSFAGWGSGEPYQASAQRPAAPRRCGCVAPRQRAGEQMTPCDARRYARFHPGNALAARFAWQNRLAAESVGGARRGVASKPSRSHAPRHILCAYPAPDVHRERRAARRGEPTDEGLLYRRCADRHNPRGQPRHQLTWRVAGGARSRSPRRSCRAARRRAGAPVAPCGAPSRARHARCARVAQSRLCL